MLADHARQDMILKLISEQKVVYTAYLKNLFHVSTETIRRDFIALENAGLIKRIHGGATYDNKRNVDVSYQSRAALNAEEKHAIAKAAADLVHDNDAIVMNTGTTVCAVAENLLNRQNLTVFTNSLYVARIMRQNSSAHVYVAGGEIRDSELTTSGYLVHEFLDHFKVDKAIIGVGGIDINNGLTDYYVEESLALQHMTKMAKEIVVVADHSKFNRCTMNYVCSLDEVSYLITDWNVPAKNLAEFKARIPNVIAAEAY